MEIRNRLFPYPVLAFYNDDYVNSVFEVEVQTEILQKAIKFNFDIKLENEVLKQLIDVGYVDYGIHIECPSTTYRDLIRFPLDHYEFEINSGKLNGKVTVCGFILAKEDIEDYSNPLFNRYYQDLEFSIEKNNIMAIAIPTEVPVEKEYDEVKGANSIFVVVPNYEQTANSIEFNMDNDVLYLRIPIKEFNAYKTLKYNENYMKTMHSLFIVPVLVQMFERFKNSEDGMMDDYSDRKWYRSLKKGFEKQNLEFSAETLRTKDSFFLAQLISENPIIGTIDQLQEMAFNSGGNSDED